MTASPSLIYEYIIGGHAITSFAKETGARPLFIALLKDPVQRIMSLYNHWQVQSGESGHSLDLDTLVGLELGILATPKAKRLLEIIATMKSVPKHSRGARAAETLRIFMTKMLTGISDVGAGKLNLRSFGLVLDGLYLPQIYGWWRLTPLIQQGSLLVVKSEYFKENRERCVSENILPFLFPMKTKEQLSAIIANTKLPRVMNTKPDKDPSSQLSEDTMKKLSAFYKMYAVEPFLFALQERGDIVVVPPLKKNEEWWP